MSGSVLYSLPNIPQMGEIYNFYSEIKFIFAITKSETAMSISQNGRFISEGKVESIVELKLQNFFSNLFCNNMFTA